MQTVRARPAVPEDLPALRDIEWAAGQQYRNFELGHVADDEPPPIDVLARYAVDGRSWVATNDSDQPIGYIIVDIIDGSGHIEQVRVVPDCQGRGVGRALIEHVKNWAISMNLSALTLTTFGHIPCNRPLYEHLGFRVLRQNEITPGVQEICETEADHGLDPNLRVVMQLDLYG
jgi:GNAT superfamily N-acetyltransferase